MTDLDLAPINSIDYRTKQLNDLFINCDSPFDAWDSKIAKSVLYQEYVDWILSLADWSSFITLTFRDPIGYDPALNKFRYLVRVLNKELFGNHYTRIVKHSYFSYVLCAEYQTRDVLHYHLLIDRPVDYLLIHDTWEKIAGFAQTKRIVNRIAAVRYVIKYAIKENDIRVYVAKALFNPSQFPIWWKSVPEETI